MCLEFDAKYEKSKIKVAKRIGLSNIENTEKLFKPNLSSSKLNIKILFVAEININNPLEYLAIVGIEFYLLENMILSIFKIL